MAGRVGDGALGAVLAGGQGRRMGSDKALVLFHGRPLIDPVLDAMLEVFREVLIVGRGAGWLERPGVRCIPDEVPGKGPLGGLTAALAAADGRAVFLVGCDMPFLVPAAIRIVLERLPGSAAAVPVVGGIRQSLHAAYGAECLPVVRRHLAEGKLSMRALLAAVQVREIDEDTIRSVDPGLRSVVSVNTREEIELVSG